MVGLPSGDTARSGGIQLGQGTAVLEVVDFLLVKAFSVLVEAQEKEFLKDLID